MAYREQLRSDEPEWFNDPVPSFGNEDTRLLIVGLAPGVRGANRTGRPFTGDYAGDLLYATLQKFGFAQGSYGGHAGDGLRLVDCMVTNAVRCVPPQNKPVGAEINACRQFLQHRITSLPKLTAIVTLGLIAHQQTVRALGGRVAAHKFRHQAQTQVGPYSIISSYHCSRYNTNTGRLTEAMFHAVFADVRQVLDAQSFQG